MSMHVALNVIVAVNRREKPTWRINWKSLIAAAVEDRLELLAQVSNKPATMAINMATVSDV
jgi:hypothetical protein